MQIRRVFRAETAQSWCMRAGQLSEVVETGWYGMEWFRGENEMRSC
jgi:hypothetical protein